MFQISGTHSARTWLLDDRSPIKDFMEYGPPQQPPQQQQQPPQSQPQPPQQQSQPQPQQQQSQPPQQQPPPGITSDIQSGSTNQPPSLEVASDVQGKNTDLPPAENDAGPILQVCGLTVSFGRGRNKLDAIKNVSFEVKKSETFGIVGESGSGKTTLGRTIMRIYEPSEGKIIYKGMRVSGRISRAEDELLTRGIQMIFQDPMSSLNERAKIFSIVAEGLLNIGRVNHRERSERVLESLSEVGLRPETADRFPHEFSGGQRQRIGIARAMIMSPDFIIADEPVSALDVSIRAQVLNLMSRLQRDKGLSYLFISHDLSVMRYICDRIAALYRGVMVELADTETLFRRPLHPYTQSLISAIPRPDPDPEHKIPVIPYDPAQHQYEKEPPSWREAEPGHFVYCNDREEERFGAIQMQ
jgi:oligopeptide transport system ATP-binding protein